MRRSKWRCMTPKCAASSPPVSRACPAPVDSLSAIKYAKVYPVRNEEGIVTDFRIEGDFPKYGNNDDRADNIAVWLLKTFMTDIKSHYTYRESIPTTSILTITSNVVYGKKTGNTPDGRRAGTPLAPGANPMHGRDTHGAPRFPRIGCETSL